MKLLKILQKELKKAGFEIDLDPSEPQKVFKMEKGPVGKISCDSKEARIATWQAREQHRLLPRVLGVWGVCQPADNGCEKECCFAILREDLSDLPIQGKNKSHFNHAIYNPTNYRIREKLDELTPEEFRWFEKAESVRNQLKSEKCLCWADYHMDNFGIRKNAVVVRDLGSISFCDAGKTVMAFDNWTPDDYWAVRII